MFEKEAEEYAENREVCNLLDAISEDLQNYDYGTVAHYNIDPLVEECFKDGAEFGYNKALEEATHNYNAIIADYDKRIAELEKENADLEIYNEELLDDDIEKHSKIVELQAQIGKMKCCQNCKHCTEIKNYKALGGKEISKVCSDGNYVCDKWEIKEK